MEGVVIGVVAVFIVGALIEEFIRTRRRERYRTRPCPRCGEGVAVGVLDCPYCGFDFRTIGA
jgi:uncharacterized OB-fold protein